MRGPWGDPLDELLERVPDEFYQWVLRTKVELAAKFEQIERDCRAAIAAGDKSWTQKEWALHFLKPETKPLAPVLFEMLKGADYARHIWKMVKPVHSSPFKDDEA